jgi:uncharacterized surface protein with fasciclin (FAS1) repeats
VADAGEGNVVEAARAAGQFNTLAAALKAAGLTKTLEGAGPFTVFAPTDEAFAKLPAGTLEKLLRPENKRELARLLTFHVLPARATSREIIGLDLDAAKTVSGKEVAFQVRGSKLTVGGANVVKADVPATNGVIHVIDRVLMPEADLVETAAAAGQFKTLAAALKAAGLVDALKADGPFTVFAPTDEAFAKLPHGTLEKLLRPENKQELVELLTYHVLPARATSTEIAGLNLRKAKTVSGKGVKLAARDGRVLVDGVNVTKADVTATNGVIHVIDQVLMPS